MRPPFHPDREDLELASIFDALADPTRLRAIAFLAEVGEATCSEFRGASKTNLAYHLRRLREAGIVRTRLEGTRRHMSLRREDLDARFPGLLDLLVKSARGTVQRRGKTGPARASRKDRAARRA